MLTACIFASMVLTALGLAVVILSVTLRDIKAFNEKEGIDLERQLAKIFPTERELPFQQSAPSHRD